MTKEKDEKIHYMSHSMSQRTRCGRDTSEVCASLKLDLLTCKKCLTALGVGLIPDTPKGKGRIHFEGWNKKRTACGINSGEYEVTGFKEAVTCKSCIGKMRPNFEALEAK